MKGIVLETSSNEAVILCSNGTVSKIKNKHYKKGQVLNMNNKFKLMTKAGSIAAALAITAVTGFAYTNPSTYVSLDVNPSIEYKLNAFDRVISVVAVNEDGEKVVNELDLKNEKVTEAVLKTIEKLKEQGYLTEEDYSGVVIAVSNKDKEKSDKLASDIEDEIGKDSTDDKEVKDEEDVDKEETDDVEKEEDKEEEKNNEEIAKKDEEDEDDIQIVVEAVGRERVEEARKLNVTPGKLNLVQKLIASTDDFDDINEEQLQELLGLSVKEINKMTNAYRKGLEFEFEFKDNLEEDEDETVKTDEVVKDDKKGDTEVIAVEDEDKDDEKVDKAKNNKVKEEKEKKNNGKVSKIENEDDYDDNEVNVNGSKGNSGNNGNNGKNKNN